jgi:hypothetical protein
MFIPSLQSSREWSKYTLGQVMTCALLNVQWGQLWSIIISYINAHHSETAIRVVCIVDRLGWVYIKGVWREYSIIVPMGLLTFQCLWVRGLALLGQVKLQWPPLYISVCLNCRCKIYLCICVLLNRDKIGWYYQNHSNDSLIQNVQVVIAAHFVS